MMITLVSQFKYRFYRKFTGFIEETTNEFCFSLKKKEERNVSKVAIGFFEYRCYLLPFVSNVFE